MNDANPLRGRPKSRQVVRPSVAMLVMAFLGAGLSAAPALAQAPSRSLAEEAESWGEVRAEDAWRILQGQTVYDPSGRWIGRVVGLTAEPATGALQVTVRLRPRFGGRNYRMPLAGFRREAGRLISPAAPAQLRRSGPT